MAIMIPELNDSQLAEVQSNAERKLYKIFKENLPDSYYVFFQVSWIMKKQENEAKDGETDFVICHPKYGYLCIEVKGGGISFDATTKEWFSINYNQEKNSINDPIEQVRRAKYSILCKLKESNEWHRLNNKRIGMGHAVFFPDVKEAKEFIRPDMPLELIGTSENIQQIKKWVEGCFKWWEGDGNSIDEWGETGIEIFKNIFAKSITASPLLSSYMEETERKCLNLTNEQIKILSFLKQKRRVAVSGGAGTGKTVLALEKAKKLANEGFHTLLTCYNKGLAEYLKKECKDEDKIDVMYFHQLCSDIINKANRIAGKDFLEDARSTYIGEDEFQVLYPCALMFALDYVEDRYDAVVCDEGQDFGEEYWGPLEYILVNGDNSPLYIFYDDNQNLYSRVRSFPIPEDNIFSLTKNCRNTVQIYNMSYKYYKGDPIESSNIQGIELEYEIANTLEKQAIKIQSNMIKLISEQEVKPSSIAILIADAKIQDRYINTLMNLPLPRGVKLTTIEDRDINQPILTTVNKFKGLEADVVFLWGLDSIISQGYEKYIYVGLSRAKLMAIIVGNEDTCKKIKEK